MKCEHCGATIDPGALACPYCKAPTARAAEARARQEHEAQSRAQWDAAQAHAQSQMLGVQLAATARQTLIWSLVGIVLCCTPAAIVAVVHGFRARGMAARLRSTVPTGGTVGLVLGFLGVVTSVTGITLAMIDSHNDQVAAEARVAALKKTVATASAAPRLDDATACALAEIHALETGFDNNPGYSLKRFECVGKLTQTGETARLETFRFRWSTTKTYEVNACFKKGGKWYVTSLTKGGCT